MTNRLIDYYGSDTKAVHRALRSIAELDRTVFSSLREQTPVKVDSPYRFYLMPRDYAWQAFHAGLELHGLVSNFNALWVRLRELLSAHGGNFPACDFVCVTMLTSYVDDDGPFTRTDFDTLMAPWRSVVNREPRAVLFLGMAARWPYPGGELWPIVDAVLAEASV